VITLHFQVFTFHRRKCSVFERCRHFGPSVVHNFAHPRMNFRDVRFSADC
jgi:hypothetical protein